ncbi:hypothetical protein BDK51DRAFT_24722 [Blyttiomyces helicus]|uniref:Uncharacterized protein n=1 Tax=Blyttiomyces helicus TaxID=388810 RepID=A0A4P9WDX4_9FUNG|nr:hypothetical protein BDK51DRAFT_24722 [Blyttiomyces helicus]|eukprot:RKO90909.1 hypothetical protein BDK51DRAFT_24722 [Blyttiomyces helicus]
MSTKLTLFMVGPAKSGKSAICNYLAELSDNSSASEYHPTQGVRILEFERSILADAGRANGKPKAVTVAVELWDCSGDPRHNFFSSLKETQIAIFAHKPACPPQMIPKLRLANKSLARAAQAYTSLDFEPETIRTEFDNLIHNAYTAYTESREREEQSIVA